MNKTYLLIDSMNLIHRARYVANSDIDEQIGMSFHIILNSINKMWRKFNGDHVVFFLDGKSWRKDVYPKYKLNREIKKVQRSEKEVEDDELFFEAVNEFFSFLNDKTNASVIRHDRLEADDLISLWVDMHENDTNIIISGDSDFVQLLDGGNVKIYNGLNETLLTKEGIFDKNDNPLPFKIAGNSKIKILKEHSKDFHVEEDWYEWAMFLKMIRGDKSDNIFSAYPGARVKGSSKKVGIRQAFEDRKSKGYDWNTFMKNTWKNHEGEEVTVEDSYKVNKLLIDLREQPDGIKLDGITAIQEAQNKDRLTDVGRQFMLFCKRWDLKKIQKYPDQYAKILNSYYE